MSLVGRVGAVTLVSALAIVVGGSAREPEWSGRDEFAHVGVPLSDERVGGFSLQCEPSASGGRTIPSFILRLPLEAADVARVTPVSIATLRLDVPAGSSIPRAAVFDLDGATYTIVGGAGAGSVTVQAYAGGDARARAACDSGFDRSRRGNCSLCGARWPPLVAAARVDERGKGRHRQDVVRRRPEVAPRRKKA
jgi:hypothetical protein